MIPETKICGICLVEKSKEDFQIRRKPKGYVWLRRECKLCQNKLSRGRYKNIPSTRERVLNRGKIYAEKNKDRVAEYSKMHRLKNKEKYKLLKKQAYELNKEAIKKRRKEYYRENEERHKATVKEYSKNNRDKLLAAKRINHKKRRANDLHYKMMKILRNRVTLAVKKRGIRCYKTTEVIGCSVQFLIQHLESKFVEGMNWGNHGLHGWHIDHIIPCAAFNLKNPEEQKKCFHYSNLQPLWWLDNMKKGAKIAA